jgi:hypothetical protein
MNKDDGLIQLLSEYWVVMLQAKATLKVSYDRCKDISLLSDDLTMEDSDALDALTSKFARTSDLYTQKFLNGLLRLKRVDAQTYVDKMNNCEKAGIILSAESMIAIRDLRNEIAHEYWLDQLRDQQNYTIEHIPLLFINMDETKLFM